MTAKQAKDTITAYFMNHQIHEHMVFHDRTLTLCYQQNDYTIEFPFFVDNFGGKIWISSQCAYKLKVIDQFYASSNVKRTWLNNFRERTVSLHNLYSGLDKMAIDNYFKVNKDENFVKSITLQLNQLTTMICFIIGKLKHELENHLANEFHHKKPGVFDFSYHDESILYSLYKPNELYHFLVNLKKIYSQKHDEEELENYRILLGELCDLHQFNYEELEPKQTFWVKIRSAFAA